MMPGGDMPSGARTTTEADEAEMERHGITRVVTDAFYCGEYRYAKLSDAIAQAKRVASKPLPD